MSAGDRWLGLGGDGPRLNEGIDPAAVEARMSEARQSYRGQLRASDTALALGGVLILTALGIGVGWRILDALL